MMITSPTSNVLISGNKIKNQTFTSTPPKIINQSSFFSEEIKGSNLISTFKKIDNKELNKLMVLLMSENKQDPEKIQKQLDKVTEKLTEAEKEDLTNRLIKTSTELKKSPKNKSMMDTLKSGNASMPCVLGAVLYFGSPEPTTQHIGALLFWLSFFFIHSDQGGTVL